MFSNIGNILRHLQHLICRKPSWICSCRSHPNGSYTSPLRPGLQTRHVDLTLQPGESKTKVRSSWRTSRPLPRFPVRRHSPVTGRGTGKPRRWCPASSAASSCPRRVAPRLAVTPLQKKAPPVVRRVRTIPAVSTKQFKSKGLIPIIHKEGRGGLSSGAQTMGLAQTEDESELGTAAGTSGPFLSRGFCSWAARETGRRLPIIGHFWGWMPIPFPHLTP